MSKNTLDWLDEALAPTQALRRLTREVVVCDCGCGEIAPLLEAYYDVELDLYFYNQRHMEDYREYALL